MTYIIISTIIVLGFATGVCIAYWYRGRVRKRKEVEQKGMPYIDNLFDTVETFYLEDYIDDTDPFEATELQGHKN